MATYQRNNFSAILAVAFCLSTSSVQAFLRDSSPVFDKSLHLDNLDATSFEERIDQTNEVWLVDFYSPWCPHCRHFAPEYEKIAAFYADSKVVHIGAVDCTKNDKLCDREEIVAYPALKLFNVPPSAPKAVKLTGYGNRNMKGVINWVETLLKENNMQSGIEVNNIDQQIEMIRNDRIQELVGDQVVEKESSMAMKYARLQDAGSAAIFGLEHAFFMGRSTLSGERYVAAVKWVEALATTFPLATNRKAFAELLDIIKQRDNWEQSSWVSVVAKWKVHVEAYTFPPTLLHGGEENWKHCTTYTCGLWTLFHSMSAQTDASDCQLLPSELAYAVRLFVMHFFGCAECVEHFLRANPESVILELAKRDNLGARGVSMWLWKMHGIVNRVTKKKFWPSLKQCPICFADGVTIETHDPEKLVESQLVAFLHDVYGVQDDMVASMSLAHGGMKSLIAMKLNGAWTQVLLLLGVVGTCVAFQVRRSRPFHKHSS